MKHDTQGSVDFLEQFRPGGPWVLTAIVPDGKTTTKTFDASSVEDMRAWIEDQQGRNNVYFHVNPTRTALTVKAGKQHIERMDWLHVDVDPRPGENPDDERERAFTKLTEHDPPPTVVIDSGGGYQAFWRLNPDPRLKVEGDVSKAETLEAYNKQLENVFGADKCHNIDRIMRLPGTVNVPNKKKRKKGRKPALAKLVAFHEDRAYDLDLFTPAVQVQTPGGGLGGRPKLRIDGNVERVDLEDLDEYGVKDYVKMLILQGTDPEDPTKYPSRSEVLFRVCCELVRANVPDEKIYAVITDPDYDISESVLDKGSRSEKYALRQIEQAHEEAENPVLREMNEKYCVISNLGGKCRVVQEVIDPALNRPKLSKITFEDFRNQHMHIRVQVGEDKENNPIYKKKGNFWLENENRRQYDALVFAPGQELDGLYNLWQGFAFDALPGDKHKPFLAHVLDNICQGDQRLFDYLMDWTARVVQTPATPGEVAVVLRGRQGTGKSFFAKQIGRLFGRHFMQVSDPKHLVGSFNSHLRDVVWLLADEAFWAGDKKHESVLKTMITEDNLAIEGKGVDVEISPNYTHLILASNSQWVVPAGAEERRFFVLDVGEERMQDTAYFRAIVEELEAGGYQNLLYYLMTRDLSQFEVRAVPKTEGLVEQKVLSMSPEEQWWHEKLVEGRLLPRHKGWQKRCLKDELYEDYIEDQKAQGTYRRASKTAFGRFLSRACPGTWPQSKQELVDVKVYDQNGWNTTERQRKYVVYFPPLDECRQYWNERYGGGFAWETPHEDGDHREEPTGEMPF